MESRSNTLWTFAITSVALFMVTLDNLVVTSALPVIRRNLHASLTQLEWTVNAYTLTFAVLLLTGAALGDRYGRRLMFSIGIGVFTLGSAVAAMSTTATGLDLARALQGVGGAIVTPARAAYGAVRQMRASLFSRAVIFPGRSGTRSFDNSLFTIVSRL